MTIIDLVVAVTCAIILISSVIFFTWRITCFFRRSCKWKNCPYRQYYHPSLFEEWGEIGCKKFPFTQEELDEQEKMYDELEEYITQLKEENSRSQQ